MNLGPGSLANLARIRDYQSRRLSSWDRTGGNRDCLTIRPGETAVLGEIAGAGIVKHIWMTMMSWPAEPHELRQTVLRIFWDGHVRPSVAARRLLRHRIRAPAQRRPAPADEPAGGARLQLLVPDTVRVRSAEIENQGKETRFFYFYVDWEEHRTIDPDLGRFHAWWNRVPQRQEQRRSTATGAPTTATPTRARRGRLRDGGPLEAAEPHRRAQLRDPRRAGRRALCRLQPERRRVRASGERLVRRGRRHDLRRRRAVASPPARHRYGGLLQHRLLPKGGVQRAVPRLDGGGTEEWPWGGRTRCTASSKTRSASRARSASPSRPGTTTLANDYSSTTYWYQRGVNEALPPLPAVEARIPRWAPSRLSRVAAGTDDCPGTGPGQPRAPRAPAPRSPRPACAFLGAGSRCSTSGYPHRSASRRTGPSYAKEDTRTWRRK